MKKGLKIVLILVITIAVIVGVIFGGLYVNNKNKLKAEKSEIIEYGQKVKVSGKNMQVYMQGEGDQTFVLLPGYLTGSPKIDFELLINEPTLLSFHSSLNSEKRNLGAIILHPQTATQSQVHHKTAQLSHPSQYLPPQALQAHAPPHPNQSPLPPQTYPHNAEYSN